MGTSDGASGDRILFTVTTSSDTRVAPVSSKGSSPTMSRACKWFFSVTYPRSKSGWGRMGSPRSTLPSTLSNLINLCHGSCIAAFDSWFQMLLCFASSRWNLLINETRVLAGIVVVEFAGIAPRTLPRTPIRHCTSLMVILSVKCQRQPMTDKCLYPGLAKS